MVCIGPYNLSTGPGADTLETVGVLCLQTSWLTLSVIRWQGCRLARYSVYRVLVRTLCPLSSGVLGHLIHGFSEMIFNTPVFLNVPSPV